MSFVEIETDKGHDAFLLDEPDFHRTLAGFLAGCAEQPACRRTRAVNSHAADPLRRQEHAARSAADRRDGRAGHRACWISAAATAR